MVLEDCDIQEINKAFKFWMRENSAMPTPAEILSVIKSERAHKRDIASHPTSERSTYRVNSSSTVSWVCKSWGDFTDADKIGLQNHLEGMDAKKRAGYLQYLRMTVGYPH